MVDSDEKRAHQVQVVSEEYIESYERLVSDWFENLSANQVEVISRSPLVKITSRESDRFLSCNG